MVGSGACSLRDGLWGDVDREFEEFCRGSWRRLVAALAHYTGDPLLAEELAQDALIRAGDRWASVSLLDSPEGWTFRVGANLAASYFRRRRAERRALQRHGAPDADPADPSDRLAVHDALLGLPVRQRQAVVLRYFLGLTADEAGQAMGVSGQAVRNLTHRAVVQLRDEFTVDDEEGADVR